MQRKEQQRNKTEEGHEQGHTCSLHSHRKALHHHCYCCGKEGRKDNVWPACAPFLLLRSLYAGLSLISVPPLYLLSFCGWSVTESVVSIWVVSACVAVTLWRSSSHSLLWCRYTSFWSLCSICNPAISCRSALYTCLGVWFITLKSCPLCTICTQQCHNKNWPTKTICVHTDT